MKVTIVGPMSIYPARKNIEVGDTVTFKKELSTEHGKTVKVFNTSGEDLGFIAAKTTTALENTTLADEVFDSKEFPDNFSGKILDIETSGRKKSFLAELISETEVEVEETKNKEKKVNTKTTTKKHYREVECEITGAKKAYPDRYVPLKKLKRNVDANGNPNPIPATLEFDTENDKIVVKINMAEDGTEDWRACGHINPDKSEEGDTYKTASELKNIIAAYKVDDEDPEMEVFITGYSTEHTSLNLTLNVKVFGQTALEAATEGIAEEMDSTFYKRFKKFIEGTSLSEKAILKAYEYVRNVGNQDKARIPSETSFNNYDDVMEDVIYSLLSGDNTMLVGPMAAGKNTCLESLAYQFSQALYETQVNSYIDNDTLLGTRTIKAKADADDRDRINEEGMKLIQALSGLSNKGKLKEAIENEKNPEGQIEAVEEVERSSNIDFSLLINAMKNGETEISFQPSAIVVAMERGAWVVVDEFNTGQPSVMAVLNSVLDDRKRIQVPGYGLVKAQPGFRLFATMNPDYEGTCSLNPATASRFTHIEFRAADKITPIILSRVPDAKKAFLSSAEKVYKHIRDGIATGKIQSESINIRGFIRAAKAVNMDQNIKRALIVHVVNGINDIDDKKAIKDFIEINIS